MVAHEKRNSAQLFWAVPTQNNSALSFLFFHRPTHTKVGIARNAYRKNQKIEFHPAHHVFFTNGYNGVIMLCV